MTATLDQFPARFYKRGPEGPDGPRRLRGVMREGTCGAPCWQPAAIAVATGRIPTLAEKYESAGELLSTVDLTLRTTGADEVHYDPDDVRELRIVQDALSGAGMVLVR
jgi:hypothetical protein